MEVIVHNPGENRLAPFPRAYWVEPGKLLAGEYPGAKDPGEARRKSRGLLDRGIRHVINLMEPDERDFQGDFTRSDPSRVGR